MAISVANIISSIRQAIQDNPAVKWTDDVLVDYLNEAQMEISRYKPDSNIKNTSMTTVAGILQTLPSDAIRLIDVPCNTSGNAIVHVDKKALSMQNPAWPNTVASANAKAFMFNDADPTRFYVFPPSVAGSSLRVVYSARPTTVSINDNISISDEYKSSIVHYVCFKAYSEDSISPDTNKAAMFNTLFVNSLQMSDQADKTVQPGREMYAGR